MKNRPSRVTRRHVSVIVPFHDDEPTLEETLAALAVQTVPPEEVLLVDDGSTDRGPEVARAWSARDPRFRVLAKAAGGEASALNAGLEALIVRAVPSEGEAFVAIVEADVALAPDWLERALGEFDAVGAVAGVGGLLAGDRRDPWIARLAAYEVEERFPSGPADVPHITSAAAVYRRSALERVGRFREDLFNASLDSELNARVRAAGFRLRFTPAARAAHRYKPTLGRYLARQYAYGRYRRGAPTLFLYPRDRLAAVELLATWALGGGTVFLLAVGAFAPAAAAAAACAAIHLPLSLRVVFERGDPAAALGALLAFPMRYAVFGLGALAGLIRK